MIRRSGCSVFSACGAVCRPVPLLLPTGVTPLAPLQFNIKPLPEDELAFKNKEAAERKDLVSCPCLSACLPAGRAAGRLAALRACPGLPALPCPAGRPVCLTAPSRTPLPPVLQVAAEVSPDVVRAEVGLRLYTVPLVLAALYYTAKAQFPSLAAAASEYTQGYSTQMGVLVVIGTLVYYAWAEVQAAMAGAAAAAKKR